MVDQEVPRGYKCIDLEVGAIALLPRIDAFLRQDVRDLTTFEETTALLEVVLAEAQA